MPQCVSPVCVVSHAERHLRSVSPSTVAPVCALVSCVIQFCAHVAVEALQMNAGTGLLLSNTSPEGCMAHVFSSSSGTSKEKDSSFHVMVCQVVSHWKASPVWTAHERLRVTTWVSEQQNTKIVPHILLHFEALLFFSSLKADLNPKVWLFTFSFLPSVPTFLSYRTVSLSWHAPRIFLRLSFFFSHMEDELWHARNLYQPACTLHNDRCTVKKWKEWG